MKQCDNNDRNFPEGSNRDFACVSPVNRRLSRPERESNKAIALKAFPDPRSELN